MLTTCVAQLAIYVAYIIFKHYLIRPIIKKPSLDPSSINN